ncbi:RluA family pseudouridine synthase [Paraliomyxa miuraensis]|uniref:RluA family pseudouridine synthase n=1 Tax=Paraliomyxa miuraensis TaxID=376150 RepID=UPI00225A0B72|nr:RNA pseudouridine synthase [Paraliomyxa miuraensis]MCX4247995.1 RNA pseudouridine synthase [Paraliomyxa miuraensis]
MPGPVPILYQGSSLLVVAKPAGVPTEPTRDPSRPSVVSILRAELGLPADAFLQVPHRLDLDTSGVLLLARDRRTLVALGEAFSSRAVHKVYLALVHGAPEPEQGRWESFLGQVERSARHTRWGSVRAGGKKAITEYRVLRRDPGSGGVPGESPGEGRSLIECRPRTGRTHQLRVHLSEAGCPIVGDERYGAPAGEHARVGRFMLHAWRVVVPAVGDEPGGCFEREPEVGFGAVPMTRPGDDERPDPHRTPNT